MSYDMNNMPVDLGLAGAGVGALAGMYTGNNPLAMAIMGGVPSFLAGKAYNMAVPPRSHASGLTYGMTPEGMRETNGLDMMDDMRGMRASEWAPERQRSQVQEALGRRPDMVRVPAEEGSPWMKLGSEDGIKDINHLKEYLMRNRTISSIGESPVPEVAKHLAPHQAVYPVTPRTLQIPPHPSAAKGFTNWLVKQLVK